jgi:hypothetical protein
VVFGSDPPRRASLILPKNKGSEARLAINRRNPTPILPTHTLFLHKKAYQRQAGRQRSTTTQTGMTVTDPDGEDDDEGLALGSIFTVSRKVFVFMSHVNRNRAVLYCTTGMGYGNRSLLVHHRPNRQSQYMKT